MKFENTRVMNLDGAFRGLRNPLESWEQSDSFFGIVEDNFGDYQLEIAHKYAILERPELDDDPNSEEELFALEDKYAEWLDKNGIINTSDDCYAVEVAYIGPKDLNLAKKLIKAGPSHRKFLRQIFVCVDIAAPLYW